MNTQFPEQRILGFIHFLRTEDFSLGIQESSEAISLISTLQEPESSLSRSILRAIACRSPEEWQRFDTLFRQYWYPNEYSSGTHNVTSRIDPRLRRRRRSNVVGLAGSSSENMNLLNEDSDLIGSGAGRQTTISKSDFRFITDQKQMYKVERLAEKLALSLRKKLNRKYVYQKHGLNLAIRQTLRGNLANGGMPLNRIFKERDYQAPSLLILHDVSHSMTWNNPLLFRFARGLVRNFKSCEAFAFHTELFPVSELYRQHSLLKMKAQLEDNNQLKFGGTSIAKSIAQFNQEYAAKTLKKDSIVLILSDGFDTDEPKELAEQLEFLHRKAKKIIWLSPMLGRQGYEANTETMSLAKKHIDSLLSAHSLSALQETIVQIRQYC